MNYGRNGITKRKIDLNARGPKWSRKFLLLLLEAFFVVLIGGGIIAAAMGIGTFKGILDSAPDITNITVTPSGRSSFVYDTDGKQIAKLVSANANRIPVSSEQISDDVKHAFVAIEDERFYDHNGIDIQGILRAGFSALKSGHLGQGASTITQQLLKNNVFTDWTSENSDVEKVKRKVQEQYLAIQLEKKMTKDEILVNYLNTINLGQNTLGVQAASLRYFGKNASELGPSEAAVIAGIAQNPTRYNPIIYPENNAGRREDVLEHMYVQGYITEEEYERCLADDVYSRIKKVNEEQTSTANTVTSYFVDALTKQVRQDLLNAGYNENQVYTLMYSGGIKIYSTQDSKIQKIVDEEIANEENYPVLKYLLNDYRLTVLKADGSFENHSAEMFKAYFRQQNASFNMMFSEPQEAYDAIEEYKQAVLMEGDEVFAESEPEIFEEPQISFSLIEQSTGKVVAINGGRGLKDKSASFNRATQAKRQPGSCFKVLASFGPAIDAKGMTLATVFNDAAFNYYDGTPVTNWFGKDEYRGLVNIRYSIEQSMNVIAVKCITVIDPQLAYEYLINFGFTTIYDSKVVNGQIYTDIGQPLALGGVTDGVINIELGAAYAAIANDGIYQEPIYYTRIEDADGNLILDRTAVQEKHQVLQETTAFLLTNAMQDVITKGTGTSARFSGMSIAGKTGTTSDQKDVWFSAYTPYYTGTCWVGYDNNLVMKDAETRPVRGIWKAIMERIHEDLPDIGFEVPAGIERCTVCRQSGLLPTANCTDVYSEYFTKDTVPTETCNVHFVGRICAIDHLPATDLCPFAYEGVGQFIPPEDEALLQGSTALGDNAALDPLQAGTIHTATPTGGKCQHNEAWFAQPGWEDLYYQQYAIYEAFLQSLMNPQPNPEGE
ncbi:MAG: transglycosylase domain-containing protein [Lachnospiraceae bacterium]|nr:transglycosylase domain-containing protein [Lachnospiraceae bacterium]